MKCLLIGIALSACLSVWSGPDTSKLSTIDRGQPTLALSGGTQSGGLGAVHGPSK